tara:strand:- start:902 stop:1726 length:825 start_codon:yes stop_codon:yes gene_type:complete
MDLAGVLQIDINITDLCNRTCSFCPRGDASVYPNNNQNMSLELFDLILNQIDEWGFRRTVILAGRGESTNHPQFEKILERFLRKGRRYRTQITTNGWRLDRYWKHYKTLDNLVLNTYTSEKDFEERRAKYPLLDNGERIEDYWKPDGLSITEINHEPDYFDPKGGNFKYKHVFNHRAGLIVGGGVVKGPCIHPMRGIFINFDGELQMCCNDWSHQIGFANVKDVNLFREWRDNEELSRISKELVNGNRDAIAPCSMCDVACPKTKLVEEYKKWT